MSGMPAFRNLKSRRSSGRIPIVYDEQGWETLPAVLDYPQTEIFSPHSSVTSPSTASADSDFEHRPVRKSKSKSRSSHPSGPDHVPRPKNAFIFYRSYYYKKLGGSDQNQISVAAGKAWKALCDEERLPFQLMAKKEKRDHQAKFPHYTYAPGSKGGSAKRKTSGKKKSQPSTKTALISTPKHIARRASHTQIPPLTRIPTPPAEIVIPTLPHPSPVVAEAPEPMLTNEETPASESIFTRGWSFVPTSEIPPLELSPAKSEKEELQKTLWSLRPASYDSIDQQFLPAAVPVTVESYFASTPQLEPHYNYVDLPDFGPLVSCSPLASYASLDWPMDTAGSSQDIVGPSYLDYQLLNDSSDSSSFDRDATFMHETLHGEQRPVSPLTIPGNDELEMEKYINYIDF